MVQSYDKYFNEAKNQEYFIILSGNLYFREHESQAEEQGDYCEFCGFCVQKYLTQTTQTGADFTPHGIRVI